MKRKCVIEKTIQNAGAHGRNKKKKYIENNMDVTKKKKGKEQPGQINS